MRALPLFAMLVGTAIATAAHSQSVRLNVRSPLDTQGMESSEIFQSLYRGHFAQLRARRGFEEHIFPSVFVHSATAFATVCPKSIAAGSPTVRVTAIEKDGLGNVIHTSSREYKVDRRFAEKADAYGIPHSRNTMGNDLLVVFQRNGCETPHVRRYLENVLHFAYGRPAAQTPPQ